MPPPDHGFLGPRQVSAPNRNFFRFTVAIGGTTSELIRNRESEQPQCKLMLWFDGQNIATD